MARSSNTYNRPFLTDDLELIRGYSRQQGVLFRKDDERFASKSLEEVRERVKSDSSIVMVNRNQGSGTRILIDGFLGGSANGTEHPRQSEQLATPLVGYAVQARSHNAVAASIAQGRSDWGIAIEVAAKQSGLGFLPLQDEEYDFIVRRGDVSHGVSQFREILSHEAVREALVQRGLRRNP